MYPSPYQSSQEVEHRSKSGHIVSGGALRETALTMPHVRHPGSINMSHVHRIQGESTSPAYTSPTAITPKSELSHSLQKGPQSLSSGLTSLLPSAPSNIRPDLKPDHAGHPSVDMVQLLKVGLLYYQWLFRS